MTPTNRILSIFDPDIGQRLERIEKNVESLLALAIEERIRSARIDRGLDPRTGAAMERKEAR